MADEAYYLRAYNDFIEMSLDGCAAQVLREGLQSHPNSQLLRELAGEAVPEPEVPRPLACNASIEIPGEHFWPELGAKGLEALLLERGGLIRVTDAFAPQVAEGTLDTLQQFRTSQWVKTSHDVVDYGGNEGAKHSYYVYSGQEVDHIRQKLSTLDSNRYGGFQAAKYETSGHISPHDDSQYFFVPASHCSQRYPAEMLMFRKIAIIYYLTKDWREEYGGCLVDLHKEESPIRYVPLYNSLVAFLVPRVHEVEKLSESCPARFTVFGWLSDDKPYLPLSQHGPALSTLDVRTRT